MKDVNKRKTAINAKGFTRVYGCTDFVGAGPFRLDCRREAQRKAPR